MTIIPHERLLTSGDAKRCPHPASQSRYAPIPGAIAVTTIAASQHELRVGGQVAR
jgi:hypothetical protein